MLLLSSHGNVESKDLKQDKVSKLYFARDGHYEIKPSEGNHLENPSKLKWNLTKKVKEVIQQSAADLDR